MGKTTSDNVELSDELLDGIAGGMIDDATKKIIDESLEKWKSNGFDKNEVRRMVSRAAGRSKSRDALAYLDRVW